MDGICDVKECQGLPLLGWRPLTERMGRKIPDLQWYDGKLLQATWSAYERPRDAVGRIIEFGDTLEWH